MFSFGSWKTLRQIKLRVLSAPQEEAVKISCRGDYFTLQTTGINAIAALGTDNRIYTIYVGREGSTEAPKAGQGVKLRENVSYDEAMRAIAEYEYIKQGPPIPGYEVVEDTLADELVQNFGLYGILDNSEVRSGSLSADFSISLSTDGFESIYHIKPSVGGRSISEAGFIPSASDRTPTYNGPVTIADYLVDYISAHLDDVEHLTEPVQQKLFGREWTIRVRSKELNLHQWSLSCL